MARTCRHRWHEGGSKTFMRAFSLGKFYSWSIRYSLYCMYKGELPQLNLIECFMQPELIAELKEL